MRARGRPSAGLTLVLLVALLAGTVPSAMHGPSGAVAEAGSVGTACPAARVPATAFTDTVTSVHRSAIDCAGWWRVAQGRTRTTYDVTSPVTRGQSAAMIARLLRATGRGVDPVPSAGFTDTRGHRFEADIDLLTHLGIVTGVTATSFRPDAAVTRAQLASILSRTFARAYGIDLPVGPLRLTDVPPGYVHARAIAQLAAADIIVGVTATRFEPLRSVTRGQSASLVMRSTSRLVDAGRATRPTTRPAAGDPFVSATRGTWVHLFDGTLKTRASIQRMVRELAAADVNLLNVQVARRHDAYYVSSVLPRTVDPTLASGLDVLAEVLAAAHANGIEVHAWFAVAPTWSSVYDTLPAPAGWLPKEHGITAPVAQRWVTRTVDGTWSTYLDPGLPEVQDHVVAVVRELAQRYAVDGIHLDYVRYESNRHGYHPRALARFSSETGVTGTPSPTDATWSNWRRAQTRRIVTRARAAVQAARPGTELSAAVISWGAGPQPAERSGFLRTPSYVEVLQDWETWTRAGEVDVVMPMNYFRAHVPQQQGWYEGWLRFERWLAGANRSRVVPGVGGWLNRPAAVRSQVSAAMHAADGALVYSYQQPTDDGSRGIWTTLSDTRWGYRPLP